MALLLEDRPCDTGPAPVARTDRTEPRPATRVVPPLEGDTDMAATIALGGSARRSRPRGIDLLVMRVSLAMLLWARRRANRTAMSREENLRRREVAAATTAREHAAASRLERAF